MNHHLQLVTNTTPPPNKAGWEGDIEGASFQALGRATGREFKHVALDHVMQVSTAAGADVTIRRCRRLDVYAIDALITTHTGHELVVLAHGCIDDSTTAGLRRVDTVQKALATAYGLAADQQPPVLLLTSHLPEPDSQSARLLTRAGEHLDGRLIDVIATSEDFAGTRRLTRLLTSPPEADLRAPWRNSERGRQLQLFTATPTTGQNQ
jgi:hypothetical protein